MSRGLASQGNVRATAPRLAHRSAAQVRGVALERGEQFLDAGAEGRVDHPEVLDDDERARQELVELLGRDHPVQLLALALDQEETPEIAAVRLQEDGFKAFDVLLRLLPAEVLNELAEDLGRGGLASASHRPEAHENAVISHDAPPLTTRGYSLVPAR